MEKGKYRKLYILLGSNIGDRKAHFDRAKNLLELNLGRMILQSSIYETEAWGNENQESYLNQIVVIETKLGAENILNITQNVENELGRIRKNKWEARIIDIDILFIDSEISNSPNLIIPHPYIQERRFTLVPLNEIVPDFVHPVLSKSIKELLLECSDKLEVKQVN